MSNVKRSEACITCRIRDIQHCERHRRKQKNCHCILGDHVWKLLKTERPVSGTPYRVHIILIYIIYVTCIIYATMFTCMYVFWYVCIYTVYVCLSCVTACMRACLHPYVCIYISVCIQSFSFFHEYFHKKLHITITPHGKSIKSIFLIVIPRIL